MLGSPALRKRKRASAAPRRAAGRRVSFTIRVPLSAPTGAGRWSVTCGAAVTSGSFIVAAVKSTTNIEAPKVVVDPRATRSDPTARAPEAS